MNNLEKTLISGGVGTSVMTASSALLSLLPKEEFREPKQLAILIGRVLPGMSDKAQQIAGWGAHYAMGFVFAAIYVELWERKEIAHNIKNGIILGVLSGLFGLLIWKGTFAIHPLPPNNRKIDFYLERIPAHIVFAVCTTLAYQLIKKNEMSSVDTMHKKNN